MNITSEQWLKCKLVSLAIVGVLCLLLFTLSVCFNFQSELMKEHVRFRRGSLSQWQWTGDNNSGRLYYYLFNVTNSKEFLSGQDTRLHLEEVGPIVYRLKIRNEVLDQSDDTLTYRKIRNHFVEFDPERSVRPDIMNQTIIMPNLVLLTTAAAIHDWVYLVRHAFNAVTINEDVFLNKTIYYFLWDYDVPVLKLLSNLMPNVVSNCGLLYHVSCISIRNIKK